MDILGPFYLHNSMLLAHSCTETGVDEQFPIFRKVKYRGCVALGRDNPEGPNHTRSELKEEPVAHWCQNFRAGFDNTRYHIHSKFILNGALSYIFNVVPTHLHVELYAAYQVESETGENMLPTTNTQYNYGHVTVWPNDPSYYVPNYAPPQEELDPPAVQFNNEVRTIYFETEPLEKNMTYTLTTKLYANLWIYTEHPPTPDEWPEGHNYADLNFGGDFERDHCGIENRNEQPNEYGVESFAYVGPIQGIQGTLHLGP